jgi:chemotaxis protein MotA
MNFAPILAVLVSMGFILVGNALEGGHLSSLIQPTAAFIVLGGTVGSVWLGAAPEEIRLLRSLLPRVMWPAHADRVRLLEDMLQLSALVRREGMLAAEARLAELGDAKLRRGMQMLVDGSAAEDVRNVLETEIDMHEHHGNNAAKLLEDAGGYAPTIGILGAVLGLIHVMRNLSDPNALGAGIAVAFVATLYGVGSANILFLPLGKRIKKIVARDAEDHQMILAGLSAIAAGSNGRQISELLAPWVGGRGHQAAKAEPAAQREAA